MIIVGTYLVTNPYLLHPLGLSAFKRKFFGDVTKNLTIEWSLLERFNMILHASFPLVLLVVFVGVLIAALRHLSCSHKKIHPMRLHL